MSGGAVSWVTICWSFSGNRISSVTSGIPGSVSSFSEEYIVYVYFKSYIDLCAASSNYIQKKMTNLFENLLRTVFLILEIKMLRKRFVMFKFNKNQCVKR